MTLRDFYLKRAKAEFPVFLKVLKALPKDLSYKPNDRSPSAEQLVWTLTYELKALIDVVDTGKADWQNVQWMEYRPRRGSDGSRTRAPRDWVGA